MKHLTHNLKKITYGIAFALGLTANTSCEHKPLYILDSQPRAVRLVFDWEHLRPTDEQPEGMHMYFDGETKDGFVSKEYEVPTNEGLETQLPPMDCIIRGISNDNPGVELIPTLDGDVTLHVTDPDEDTPAIYGLTQNEFIENGTDNPEVQVIVTKPLPLNCIYHVEVHNTNLLRGKNSWTATLTGLTNSILLSTGKSAPTATEHYRHFALSPDEQSTMQRSTISVLGKLDGNTNILHLKAKNEQNQYTYYKVDVTQQIDNAPDPRNLTIIVDFNDLKEDDDPIEGDLTPDVDNFQDEVNEDIEI
ncbi:MAG: hypothetical protein KBT12_00600 [Bacteroidales bacterium]|nr:hypothetical protein [Candidatus Physcousia equi]